MSNLLGMSIKYHAQVGMVDTYGMNFGSRFWMHEQHSRSVQSLGLASFQQAQVNRHKKTITNFQHNYKTSTLSSLSTKLLLMRKPNFKTTNYEKLNNCKLQRYFFTNKTLLNDLHAQTSLLNFSKQLIGIKLLNDLQDYASFLFFAPQPHLAFFLTNILFSNLNQSTLQKDISEAREYFLQKN